MFARRSATLTCIRRSKVASIVADLGDKERGSAEVVVAANHCARYCREVRIHYDATGFLLFDARLRLNDI
jgi:hypothetical protein